MLKDTHTIATLDELSQFAEKLGATLKGGEVLLLIGDLGAGKTTFVQALARALGSNDYVTSPTFVLRNEYTLTRGKLLHIDMYRLENCRVEDVEFIEDVGDDETITCIEWPERIQNIEMLKGKKISISFEILHGDIRKVVTSI